MTAAEFAASQFQAEFYTLFAKLHRMIEGRVRMASIRSAPATRAGSPSGTSASANGLPGDAIVSPAANLATMAPAPSSSGSEMATASLLLHARPQSSVSEDAGTTTTGSMAGLMDPLYGMDGATPIGLNGLHGQDAVAAHGYEYQQDDETLLGGSGYQMTVEEMWSSIFGPGSCWSDPLPSSV